VRLTRTSSIKLRPSTPWKEPWCHATNGASALLAEASAAAALLVREVRVEPVHARARAAQPREGSTS
jgi:hypothetical protein